MSWRSDLLQISHKTLRAVEMLHCLHLWSLSNLLRIASVLREPSTLRCCPHWLYPVAFCGASKTYPVKREQHWPRVTISRSHTSSIALVLLAERVWYPKFQFSRLNTYFRLSGYQASLLLIYFSDGTDSCSHYMYTKERHETYPICDRSCVWTEALFSVIFVATQKLCSIVWTQP